MKNCAPRKFSSANPLELELSYREQYIQSLQRNYDAITNAFKRSLDENNSLMIIVSTKESKLESMTDDMLKMKTTLESHSKLQIENFELRKSKDIDEALVRQLRTQISDDLEDASVLREENKRLEADLDKLRLSDIEQKTDLVTNETKFKYFSPHSVTAVKLYELMREREAYYSVAAKE
eukprot:740299_1